MTFIFTKTMGLDVENDDKIRQKIKCMAMIK
jgi:hypothetical protein